MITASHNDNGWTGIKCGIEKSLTFGPDEMKEIKELALSNNNYQASEQGKYEFRNGLKENYLNYLIKDFKLKNKLKIVTACGNGTAGAFAPEVLRTIGCDVIELHCDLDNSFPNYNPNPEDLVMLRDLSDSVLEHKVYAQEQNLTNLST